MLGIVRGVGTLGLHVADLFTTGTLTCSDANPHNQACFERSCTGMSNVQYSAHSAVDMVTLKPQLLAHANVIIVDPPRKGLESTVATALATAATQAHALVYVSCGFDAFQRDFDILTQSSWKLDRVQGHVLFPGSNAIETLALFTKKSPPPPQDGNNSKRPRESTKDKRTHKKVR